MRLKSAAITNPIPHCLRSSSKLALFGAMTSAQQQAALAATNCELAFDNLTRQLYATDASIYQIEPLAVAFPRNARQAGAIVAAAAQAGEPVIPRGAGTALTGGPLAEGLVVGFSPPPPHPSPLHPHPPTP